MIICNVVGARPNFMKMAPVVDEMRRRGINQFLVHTGQHYDEKMSQVFFEELGMPRPDMYLGVGSDTHARQTARIMSEFESLCFERRPDLIVVGGDVNSTMAVALVASKLQIPVAHIEAGLRSFDRSMPEEINRIVTDHISEFLFTTESSGNENLLKEGISEEKVFFVGNCMIDSLCKHVAGATATKPWEAFHLDPASYALLTLHRPSNVDSAEQLRGLMRTINKIADMIPVLFPVHPRTRKNLASWNIPISEKILISDPLPYLAFLGCMAKAQLVLTDSGGIQEETTSLAVPCLTLRHNTERPSTTAFGTNRLVGSSEHVIVSSVQEILSGSWPTGQRPPLWDGHAAARVVDVLDPWMNGGQHG